MLAPVRPAPWCTCICCRIQTRRTSCATSTQHHPTSTSYHSCRTCHSDAVRCASCCSAAACGAEDLAAEQARFWNASLSLPKASARSASNCRCSGKCSVNQVGKLVAQSIKLESWLDVPPLTNPDGLLYTSLLLLPDALGLRYKGLRAFKGSLHVRDTDKDSICVPTQAAIFSAQSASNRLPCKRLYPQEHRDRRRQAASMVYILRSQAWCTSCARTRELSRTCFY